MLESSSRRGIGASLRANKTRESKTRQLLSRSLLSRLLLSLSLGSRAGKRRGKPSPLLYFPHSLSGATLSPSAPYLPFPGGTHKNKKRNKQELYQNKTKKTAQGPQAGARRAPRRQGHRRRRQQARQDQVGPQGRRARADRHLPGTPLGHPVPAGRVQVPAARPAPEEDARDPEEADQAPEGGQDCQGREEGRGVPEAQVRRQGLSVSWNGGVWEDILREREGRRGRDCALVFFLFPLCLLRFVKMSFYLLSFLLCSSFSLVQKPVRRKKSFSLFLLFSSSLQKASKQSLFGLLVFFFSLPDL